MLKITIGIAMIILSTIAGKNFTKKHRERVKFFSSLNDFNSELIRDISYKSEGVCAALKQSYGNEAFDEYAFKVLSAYENDDEIPLPPDIIAKPDAETVKGYFMHIGKYGRASERDYLLSKREEFKKRTEELKEYSNKFTALGGKLGFALGAALFIIVV